MKESTSIVFTGDIGFDHYMDRRWEDEHLLSLDICDFLHSADHVVVNVEGPLSERKKSLMPNGVEKLMHTMDPGAIGFLNRIHADIWNLVNNHIMDAGEEGLRDTLKHAMENNVKTLGVGMNIEEAMKPVILKEAGGIGIFGVGYQRACRKAEEDKAGCFSWSDLDRIRKVIDEIKSRCRWCIIVAHAGEEFTSLPSPYTRQRYLDYLDLGADIVVAHHPHVPMNYETFQGKAIFYSLGNFVFDTDYQRSQYNTEKGLLLRLDLNEKEFAFEPMGIKIVRGPETIEKSSPADIFEDVREEEYELLAPLAAKMFIAATKRQQIYMKPDKYSEATTDEEWHENFYEPLRSGRVPGECLDMQIIVPLAEKEKEKAWEKSSLTKVKEYILAQM